MRAAFERFLRHPRQWWGLIAFWLVLAVASFAWRFNEMERHAYELARQRGQLVFEMVETTRLWAANHGGVYAPVTEATPPNPYLDVPEKVITTPSGKSLTKINPAYMTRQLGELIGQSWDLKIHLTSLKPINPGNVADDWERGALEAFERRRDARVSVVGAGETAVFRYMAPLEVKKPCLSCHAQQGYQLGDVRGGISVTFPARYVYDIINEHRRGYLVIHVAAFLLLSSLTWGAMSLIRRHLRALESARNDLAESEKMASLGRMVAGFAHEVNTPVGVALGAASQVQHEAQLLSQMLTRDEVDETALQQSLSALGETSTLAMTNLYRAAELVQRFKLTAITQSSDAERDFSMQELLSELERQVRANEASAHLLVTASCPQELNLHGAAGALTQLLGALIENSRIHGFAGGARAGFIHITAERMGNEVVIRVEDDGIGMSDEVQQKMFEPFYTTSRGSGHSGLGLFIAYTLATRSLGGSIACTSAPGRGSRFVIRFPYHPSRNSAS